jgi:hypothetical protein
MLPHIHVATHLIMAVPPAGTLRHYLLQCIKMNSLSQYKLKYYMILVRKLQLRWSRGSVLAFGTQVRGFKPG